MHHFIRKPDEYKRSLNPFEGYQRQAATYLARRKGIPLAEAAQFVEKELSLGGEYCKDPEVSLLVRQKNGDRRHEIWSYSAFLEDVRQRNRIFAPTMTVYEDPDVCKSMLGEYLADNLNRRKRAKHAMFEAEMAQNMVLYAIKNSEQNTLKIKNNAMSGAHSSPYTILFNKSSHSTLTSTCRTATSLANANNEKLLCGNRHYYSETVVRNNIFSIATLTDLAAVHSCMLTYGLRAPTVDEVMAIIRRSTKMYWHCDQAFARLRRDVECLSDEERAAFAYVGDFYHTAELNPEFAKNFIRELSTKDSREFGSPEECKRIVKGLDSNTVAFVSILCAEELAGRQLKDVPADSPEYAIVAATAAAAVASLDKHELFIRTFWVSDNMPSSVFYMPTIIRRGAITSDTDSTIFTVQHWPRWYHGELKFDAAAIAVANVMVYFSAETIRHLLAMYSANLGANVKEIHRLSMKNEFYFPVFSLTSRAKHYFAYVAAQEGNVFKKMKMEIKGVALRSSNAPPAINQQAHALMRYMMDEVMAGRKISLTRILRAVAKIEDKMVKDILAGGFELLPSMTIKSKDSYVNPESSNYLHYEMWEAVFAPKYGHAPQPPYVGIKVNLMTDNTLRTRQWLLTLEDRGVAERMEAYLAARNKKDVAVMYLPQEVLAMHGLPPEVVQAANFRNLIANTMTPFYLVLESIGYYVRNKHNTRLVSDEQWLLSDDSGIEELDLLAY